MTQVVGLVALVLLLAFSAALFALLGIAFASYRKGNLLAARRPLALFSILTLAVAASLVTWARSTFAHAATSIAYLADSLAESLIAQPLSLSWLIALSIAFAVVVLVPGLRRWFARNFIAISAMLLAFAFVVGVVASFLSVGGGWPVVVMLALIGTIIGLGNQGLVFVPHLHDGPRIGESALSAITRITRNRIRRSMYRAIYLPLSCVHSIALGNAIKKPYSSVTAVFRGTNPRSPLKPYGWRTLRIGGTHRAFSPQRPNLAVSLAQPSLLLKGSVAIAIVLTVTVGALLVSSSRTSGTLIEQVGTSSSDASAISTSTEATISAPAVLAFKVKDTDGQGVLLREQPSQSSNSIGSLLEGATIDSTGVVVIDSDGNSWREVKDAKGNKAWAASQFLEPLQAQGIVKVANTGGEGVFWRVKPGKSGDTIGLVYEGREFRLLGSDSEAEGKTWRNVVDETGRSGWVSAEFLVSVGQ